MEPQDGPPAPEPAPAPAPGPLDGLLSMAIEGVAAYAATFVRDGLSRLVSGATGSKEEADGARPGSSGTGPLLLAVAVAAIITVLLAGRKSAEE